MSVSSLPARAEESALAEPAPPDVTLRRVFWLWLPLAISFVMMTLEAPSLQSAIGRLADPELNLAGWGLTIGLSLLVESPVIMLLATTIALVDGEPAYRLLRRLTLLLCVACTAVTALLAYVTPVYDFVTINLMHQPLNIRVAARPGLEIMLLWSAAIGWRRFCQGVIVRHGRARLVTWGTCIRLSSVLVTAIVLVRGGWLTGVETASCALMAGVLVEALVSWAFASPVVRDAVLPKTTSTALTLASVWRFHAPLAATTLLTLMVEPLNAAALGLLPHPHETLAAWPVAFITIFVIRGWGFALQEVTVALATQPGARQPLARFALIIGLITSGVAALMAWSRLLDLYLIDVLHTPAQLLPLVRVAVAICVVQPLATALGAWARGSLMAAGATSEVYKGMGCSLAAQILLLCITVPLGLPGMQVAATASCGATVVELVYLYWRARVRAAL
jgi:hypothetical protein